MKAKAVILASRPGADGEPRMENFKVQEQEVVEEPPEGHVVLKTIYLSVDPYMRCRMNEDPGTDYLSAWTVGGVAEGGGVGVVLSSRGEGLSPGDVVTSFSWPWQTHAVLPASGLQKLAPAWLAERPSLALGAVGMPGLTALLGLRMGGHVAPRGGQTLVVSGAAGACGHLAGQIARLEGCSKVVGVCGSASKCRVLTAELGFDAAVDYRAEDLAGQLRSACPKGVDLYFDNVGGPLSDTVIEQMNVGGHVVLCGQISQYNKDVPYPPPLPLHTQTVLQERNISRDRFLVLNYPDKHAEGLQQLASWVQSGQLKVKETIMDGIENVGAAFVSMMQGGNIGKQLVLVSPL